MCKGLILHVQNVGYLFYCQMIRCLECSLAGVEYLADFGVFHVLVILQGEHGALHIGQGCHGSLQFCMRLVAVKVGVCHQAGGYGWLIVGAHLWIVSSCA